MRQFAFPFTYTRAQTFSNYILGKNSATIAILRQRLERIMSRENDEQIYIWGKNTSGCSHILQACSHELQNSGLQVAFITSNAESIESEQWLDNIDVLIVDNIDNIIINTQTQIHWFHIFNTLLDKRISVIFGAHQSAYTLSIELADLQTRLTSCLNLRLFPLMDTDLSDFIASECQKRGLKIHSHTIEYILNHYERSLQSIYALLEQLDQATLVDQKGTVTIAYIKKIIHQRNTCGSSE